MIRSRSDRADPVNRQASRSTTRLPERSKILDEKLVAAHLDDIFRNELPSSSRFDFPIHFDFAALNHHLRLPTRFGNRAQFQELIETQGAGILNRVIFGHGVALLGVVQTAIPLKSALLDITSQMNTATREGLTESFNPFFSYFTLKKHDALKLRGSM